MLKEFEKCPQPPTRRISCKTAVSEALTQLLAETDVDQSKKHLKEIAEQKVERASAYDEICALDHALSLAGCGLSAYICVGRDTTWKDMPTRLLEHNESRKWLSVPDSHFNYDIPYDLKGKGKMAVVLRPKGMAQERKWEIQPFAGEVPMLGLCGDEGSNCFASVWFLLGPNCRARLGWMRDGGHRRWRDWQLPCDKLGWRCCCV